MDTGDRIEVFNREGWNKLYPLTHAITYIGSDASNEVPLPGGRASGVAPRHLQLLRRPGGYQLVNLGDSSVELSLPARDERETVLPRTAHALASGQEIQIGDFTLRVVDSGYRAPTGNGGTVSRDVHTGPIGLRFTLPHTRLSPEAPIIGSVLVQNRGEREGVQVRLEVEGLDGNCYELGPAPILFSGAEREVFFQLIHPRLPAPPAGEYQITLRATAPQAYPGASASVAQRIQLLPYYHHQLRFVE